MKKTIDTIAIILASGKGQRFDKSKLKQGRFTPGTNIRIRDPKYISRNKVDYLIILSWNIKDEIIGKRIKLYCEKCNSSYIDNCKCLVKVTKN